MKTAQSQLSSPPSELLMWVSLSIFVLTLCVQLLVLPVSVLVFDHRFWISDIESSNQGYYKAHTYMNQFAGPSYERRKDDHVESENELRHEIIELRKTYSDLSFTTLFTAKTLYKVIDFAPVIFHTMVVCLCMLVSFGASFFGTLLLANSSPQSLMRKGIST